MRTIETTTRPYETGEVQTHNGSELPRRRFSRPATILLSLFCSVLMAFASVGPAQAEPVSTEAENSITGDAQQAEEFIAEARAADPQGFEERVAAVEEATTLNDVLNELPAEEAERERQALAAMLNDPEALQGTLDLYESGAFVPYLDEDGVFQVNVDEDQLLELTQDQSSTTPEDGVQTNAIEFPECAAAWSTAIGFIAGRYPSCYAMALASRAAAITCAVVNFAADQVIDWNAACD